MQSYLSKTIDFNFRKEIAKFRISNHRLNIEVGRYKNIVRQLRVCVLCDHNEMSILLIYKENVYQKVLLSKTNVQIRKFTKYTKCKRVM